MWKNRETHLENVPGFKKFNLVKGEKNEDHTLYASHSIWDSKEDFIKGAPLFPMEDLGNTNTLKIACVPSGWDGGWHTTPVLQLSLIHTDAADE